MSFKFLRQSRYRILAAVILLVGAVVSYGITYTQAQTGAILPFGGKVVSSFFCPCNDVFLLTLTGPIGGQFIYAPYPPYEQAYESFNLGFGQTGMWAVGLYTANDAMCMVPSGDGCDRFGGPIGTFTSTVGTSPVF